MYTDPKHVREGVGRLILGLCEMAAKSEGFGGAELMATMSGEPLYRACGYEPVERLEDDRGGAGVPLLRMSKVLYMHSPNPLRRFSGARGLVRRSGRPPSAVAERQRWAPKVISPKNPAWQGIPIPSIPEDNRSNAIACDEMMFNECDSREAVEPYVGR